MELVQLIVQKKWNGRKRSETDGNSRKRSETVGNMIRPNLVQPAFLLNKHFRAKPFFFFEGPKVSKGKRLETVGDRTFARQKRHVFTHFSNIFHEHMLQNNYFFAERRCDLRLFPTVSLGHLWTFKKKTALRGNAYHPKENAGWTSFGLIMFSTVSDCVRPFHFFWTINWTNSIYGTLIQCKPVQTMTLQFFGATLVRVHCTKYCILTLISNIP